MKRCHGWLPSKTIYNEEFLLNGGMENDRSSSNLHTKSSKNKSFVKRSLSIPMLRRIAHDDILSEFYEEECGNSIRGKTMIKKILCYRYYWPTINLDTVDHARQCEKCKMFAKIQEPHRWKLLKWLVHGRFPLGGIGVLFLPILKIEAVNKIIKLLLKRGLETPQVADCNPYFTENTNKESQLNCN